METKIGTCEACGREHVELEPMPVPMEGGHTDVWVCVDGCDEGELDLTD